MTEGPETDAGGADAAPDEPDFNPFAPPTAADEAPVLEGFDDYPPGDQDSVSPLEADRRAREERDGFARRPELFVGAAFAGAFVVAKLLRRFGGEAE
jgi:hypothetical protein